MKNLKSNTKLTFRELVEQTKWYAKNKKEPYHHADWVQEMHNQIWPMFETWEDYTRYSEKNHNEIMKTIDDIRFEIFKIK